MIPWTSVAWTQVHHGFVPLWNPYNGLGLPLAFNWQSAVFSVPSLAGYLVPLRYAYTVGVIVTLVIAGTGGYVLGRALRLGMLGALMIATVFELCGPLVAWLGYPQAQTMAWGGWLFAAGLLILRGRHRLPAIVLCRHGLHDLFGTPRDPDRHDAGHRPVPRFHPRLRRTQR
jgi:hypothetical protein